MSTIRQRLMEVLPSSAVTDLSSVRSGDSIELLLLQCLNHIEDLTERVESYGLVVINKAKPTMYSPCTCCNYVPVVRANNRHGYHTICRSCGRHER